MKTVIFSTFSIVSPRQPTGSHSKTMGIIVELSNWNLEGPFFSVRPTCPMSFVWMGPRISKKAKAHSHTHTCAHTITHFYDRLKYYNFVPLISLLILFLEPIKYLTPIFHKSKIHKGRKNWKSRNCLFSLGGFQGLQK